MVASQDPRRATLSPARVNSRLPPVDGGCTRSTCVQTRAIFVGCAGPVAGALAKKPKPRDALEEAKLEFQAVRVCYVKDGKERSVQTFLAQLPAEGEEFYLNARDGGRLRLRALSVDKPPKPQAAVIDAEYLGTE